MNYARYLFGASTIAFATLAFDISAFGQAASQLPPVVVEQAKPRPAARTQRAQTARSTARRSATRSANPAAAAPVAPAIASTRETATGPVQGYLATVSGTGTKTDTPLSQTAQSISVVSAERVRDQGVSSVQETLRYVPGVFAEPGGINSRKDYFKVRGQDPNVYLDGTRVNNRNNFNEWRVDPYMLERIEVFRGPASVLYGDTSTAGLVNLISKRPRAETHNEVGVSFDNFGRKQVQIGFDRQGDQGRRMALSLRRPVPRQRDSGRFRPRQSHAAGALADLAADHEYELDSARRLSERQDRHDQRLPAARRNAAAEHQRVHPAQPFRRRSQHRSVPDPNRCHQQSVRAPSQRRGEADAEPALRPCRRHLSQRLRERVLGQPIP